MKSTTFAVLASATLAVATPKFLNSAFEDIVAGEGFELKFSGCEAGCTITIETGPGTNLKPVATLSTDATGDSLTVTIPEDLASGDYAFRIVDNGDEDPKTNTNYSKPFPVEGTVVTTSAPPTTSARPTTSSTSSEVETSTSETETSSEAESTSSVTRTSLVTRTSALTTPPTTSAPSSTESESTSTSAPASTTTTTIPDSGASGVQAQLGLVMAAAVAVAYL